MSLEVYDEADSVRTSTKTYQKYMPGRIIKSLIRQVLPIRYLFLDEIDSGADRQETLPSALLPAP